MALGTVRNQDNKCLQDTPGQSAVHPENVLHNHEPLEPGQRGLRPRGRRLCPRAGVCVDQGGSSLEEFLWRPESEGCAEGLQVLQTLTLLQISSSVIPRKKVANVKLCSVQKLGFSKERKS